MRRSTLFVLGLCTLASACRGRTPAPPDEVAAADPAPAPGGTVPPPPAVDRGACPLDPYIVGWSATEHAALEHAMRGAVAVVAYDCQVVRLLDCRAEGEYTFTAFPTVQRQVGHVADELGTPTSSADLEVAYVGMLSAARATANPPLTGSECGQATHVVRGAWIGAFALAERSDAERAVTARTGSASAGASFSHSTSAARTSGDLASCEPATTGSPPPAACRAPIRLELAVLAATRAGH